MIRLPIFSCWHPFKCALGFSAQRLALTQHVFSYSSLVRYMIQVVPPNSRPRPRVMMEQHLSNTQVTPLAGDIERNSESYSWPRGTGM